jgi:hypothetical protein
MIKLEFIEKISPRMKSILFIITLIFIGFIIGQLIGTLNGSYLIENIEGEKPQFPHHTPTLTEEQKNQILRGVNIISTILSINIVLLIGLIYVFISSYIKIRSGYLIGFVIFVGVFLIKSISNFIALTPLLSEPIRAAPLAISPLLRSNFGPFGSYFMIFEIIAICILIYLSRE